MVNRRLAVRGGKNAQKQGKQKRPGPFHNFGLSAVLAIRRLCSYQNQLPWQLNFSVRAIYFASAQSNKPRQTSLPARSASTVRLGSLESGCGAAPDFDINHSRIRTPPVSSCKAEDKNSLGGRRSASPSTRATQQPRHWPGSSRGTRGECRADASHRKNCFAVGENRGRCG